MRVFRINGKGAESMGLRWGGSSGGETVQDVGEICAEMTR